MKFPKIPLIRRFLFLFFKLYFFCVIYFLPQQICDLCYKLTNKKVLNKTLSSKIKEWFKVQNRLCGGDLPCLTGYLTKKGESRFVCFFLLINMSNFNFFLPGEIGRKGGLFYILHLLFTIIAKKNSL